VKDIRKLIQRWLRWRSIPFVIHPSGNLKVSSDFATVASNGPSGSKDILFYFGDISDNKVLIVELSERNRAFLTSVMANPPDSGVVFPGKNVAP
jgi:hypothetical protein